MVWRSGYNSPSLATRLLLSPASLSFLFPPDQAYLRSLIGVKLKFSKAIASKIGVGMRLSDGRGNRTLTAGRPAEAKAGAAEEAVISV